MSTTDTGQRHITDEEIRLAYGDEPDFLDEFVAEQVANDPEFAALVAQAQEPDLLPAQAETPYDRFAEEVVEELVDKVQDCDVRSADGDDPRTLAVMCAAQGRIVAALQAAYQAGREDARHTVDARRAG